MTFTIDELRVFEQAFTDRQNGAVRDLINLFAAESASELVAHVYGAPSDIRGELVGKVREAIAEQRLRLRR